MDYIEVVDQKIFAYHGVLKEEKAAGQYFYISFKAYLNMDEAAKKDDMALSVSYADMCQTVKDAVTGQVYDLIETVAEKTAVALLLSHQLLDRVILTVKKPSAPVGEPVAYPAVTVERSWHTAYVSLGSNVGDSAKTLYGAMERLHADDHSVITKRATIIETKPWGNVDQDNFFNSAVEVRTILSPRGFMTLLLRIEEEYNRQRDVKWGPRTLDMDLIFYDDLVSDDPYVTIPHPLMEDRAFVLDPLCEIAPNVIHPLIGKRLFRIKEVNDLNKKT